MAHGHDVLHMMEGNQYESKEQLVKAVEEKFGTDERFHTCSAAVIPSAECLRYTINDIPTAYKLRLSLFICCFYYLYLFYP